MQLAMIGLGRMGGNMAKRIAAAGHEVVGYDRSPESDRTVASLEEMVAALTAPRIVWVMVPAGEATDSTINELAELLEPGDMIIDGGNSRYTDDARHAAELEPRGIHFMDCGVSRRRMGALTADTRLWWAAAKRISNALARFSKRSSLKAIPDWCSQARSAAAISPKWCTTASNRHDAASAKVSPLW